MSTTRSWNYSEEKDNAPPQKKNRTGECPTLGKTFSSLAKPLNTINFFNAVCTLLFCFGIQLSIQHQKIQQTKQNTHTKKTSQWRSMIGWDIGLVFFLFCFLCFLVSFYFCNNFRQKLPISIGLLTFCIRPMSTHHTWKPRKHRKKLNNMSQPLMDPPDLFF